MAGLFELYLLTFNCARNLVKPEGLAPHFFDALPKNSPPPDIIAISLQEIAPIAYSFLGGSYLTPYYDRVHETVELAAQALDNGSQRYDHIRTENLGMTALMLFAKPGVRESIRWTQSAAAGVGLWNMGNKGAVAVRLGLSLGERDDEVAITFTAAHLAPMEWAVERRNQDWENIVRNLVFINDDKANGASSEAQPLLSSSSESPPDGDGLFSATTNHAFFAGDLNYRTHSDAPGLNAHRDYPRPVDAQTSPHHFSHFLSKDQLSRELEANRTLHGFEELPITFPPTYKYSNRRFAQPKDSDHDKDDSWPWAKHRYPSWCDRILFFSHPATPKLTPHNYISLPLQDSSDHQPVALSTSVKLEPLRSEQAAQARVTSPFPLNQNWRARKSTARQLEIIVGILSYLSLTKKGNAILVAVASVALATWWVVSS